LEPIKNVRCVDIPRIEARTLVSKQCRSVVSIPACVRPESAQTAKWKKPTRKASACTVRLLRPLSRIRNTRAEARLPMMRMKAMPTRIFIMNFVGNHQRTGKTEDFNLLDDTL